MIDERRDGTTTWLTFTRPENLNAFTIEGYTELRIALQRLASDGETRAVVLTGSGRAFSVGADRSLLQGPLPEEQRRSGGGEFAALLETLSTFQKPLFAAVNGLAVGLGATMLLYCDVILVAETARLRMPFTALGLVPEAGSSALFSARVRWADSMWAMLSSEWIDATAAHQMGLAWKVVPDDELLGETAAAAEVLAALDPRSVSATKRLMTEGRHEAARMANEREMVEMRALLEAKTD